MVYEGKAGGVRGGQEADQTSRYSGIMYSSPRNDLENGIQVAAVNMNTESAGQARATARNKTPIQKFYSTGSEF